jgi:ribosomal protein S18 acetylase RimI-like enzyme
MTEEHDPLPALAIRQVTHRIWMPATRWNRFAFPRRKPLRTRRSRCVSTAFPRVSSSRSWTVWSSAISTAARPTRTTLPDEEFKQLIGHEADGRNIVVFSLAVLPDYQRRGIAAALMEQFVERSRALGKERVLLLCKSELIRYYEKLGFRYVAQSLSSHGGASLARDGLRLMSRRRRPAARGC